MGDWQLRDLLTGSCCYSHLFHEHFLGISCVSGTRDSKRNRAFGRHSVRLGGQTCKQLNNRIGIIIEACVRDLRNTEEELQNSVAEVGEKFH